MTTNDELRDSAPAYHHHHHHQLDATTMAPSATADAPQQEQQQQIRLVGAARKLRRLKRRKILLEAEVMSASSSCPSSPNYRKRAESFSELSASSPSVNHLRGLLWSLANEQQEHHLQQSNNDLSFSSYELEGSTLSSSSMENSE